MHPLFRPALAMLAAAVATALLAGCATPPEPAGPLRKETVFAVTDGGELVSFNAGRPQHFLSRLPVQGLADGDRLLGIDFRVARGVLYALSAAGRLYTLDTASGRLSLVGSGASVALPVGAVLGFDFNPAADRIRVVSDGGLNLRLHPDTGTLAATDAALAYAPGDGRAGHAPQLVAAAYTYNKTHDKLTTNYAIDRAAATLVMQGSQEGVVPAVSPNTGQLRTVGALGIGPVDDAAFDISDLSNAPLAALRSGGRTRLYLIDLASGRARLLGTVGEGQGLRGLAIEP
jgi:Domain of unknown function (DUF4394)